MKEQYEPHPYLFMASLVIRWRGGGLNPPIKQA
jgi:hypothetical protein